MPTTRRRPRRRHECVPIRNYTGRLFR